MQTQSFNLIQVTAALRKRWTTILFIVVASTVVSAITVFMVPPYFKSTATVVSANPMLADKARLFNPNIQALYSYFGTGDDLDRIVGVGEMEATYLSLIDTFSLIDYYSLSGDSLPALRKKAALRLRKDLRFIKTENGQLQIVAWTKDNQLSANLVNRLVALIETTEASIWQKNYSANSNKIRNTIISMEQQYQQLSDSVATAGNAKEVLLVSQMQTLLEQIKQYRKTADEFVLAGQTIPAALYVLEPALPASYAERPDKMAIILATAIASFIFGCLLVLVNDRNNLA